jgi:hypothetical protein
VSDEQRRLDKLIAAELFARGTQLSLKAQQMNADQYPGEPVTSAGKRMRKVRQLHGLANRYMDLATRIDADGMPDPDGSNKEEST